MELEERIIESAIIILIETINVYLIYELLINQKEPESIQLLLMIIDASIVIPIALQLSKHFSEQFIEEYLELYLSIIFLVVYFIIRILLLPNINPLELIFEESLVFLIEYFFITIFSELTESLNNEIITNIVLLSAEIFALYIFEKITDFINGKDNNFIDNGNNAINQNPYYLSNQGNIDNKLSYREWLGL